MDFGGCSYIFVFVEEVEMDVGELRCRVVSEGGVWVGATTW